MKNTLVSILGLLVASALPALAHDQWADGSRVPSWVKAQCCGEAEVHHLRADQVHRVDHGWRVDGFDQTVEDSKVLPSQDGDYWAFYSSSACSTSYCGSAVMHCFFAPLAF